MKFLNRFGSYFYALITFKTQKVFVDKVEITEKEEGNYNIKLGRFNGESIGEININRNTDMIEENGQNVEVTKQDGEKIKIKFF